MSYLAVNSLLAAEKAFGFVAQLSRRNADPFLASALQLPGEIWHYCSLLCPLACACSHCAAIGFDWSFDCR